MKKIIGAVLFLLTTNFSTAQIQNNFEQRELFMMDQLTKALDPLSNINQYEQGFCSSCNKEDPLSDKKKGGIHTFICVEFIIKNSKSIQMNLMRKDKIKNRY